MKKLLFLTIALLSIATFSYAQPGGGGPNCGLKPGTTTAGAWNLSANYSEVYGGANPTAVTITATFGCPANAGTITVSVTPDQSYISASPSSIQVNIPAGATSVVVGTFYLNSSSQYGTGFANFSISNITGGHSAGSGVSVAVHGTHW